MKPSPLQRAILTLNARQMADEAHSHIADIDVRALFAVTVIYLAAMLSVPVGALGMLIWFAVYPVVMAPLAHVAYERVLVNSLVVLPLLLAVGIFNPFLDHAPGVTAGGVTVSRGWITLISIVIRGLLAMQALLLLIRVAGFNNLCVALRQFKLPMVLVTQLQMVYRYMTVLLQEAQAMQLARQARGYSRGSYRLKMWGTMVGQLMIRTIDRSQRIHRAMLARGFNGLLPVSAVHRWATADTVYCMAWVAVIAAMRFINLSAIFTR